MSEQLITKHYREFEQGAAAFGLHMKKEHIVLLQAIVESYDHLGLVRTLPGMPTRVAILTSADRKNVVEELLQSIREDLPWNPAQIDDVPENVVFAGRVFS